MRIITYAPGKSNKFFRFGDYFYQKGIQWECPTITCSMYTLFKKNLYTAETKNVLSNEIEMRPKQALVTYRNKLSRKKNGPYKIKRK